MKSAIHNSFLSRLENNTADDLLVMREAVQAMVDTPGWAFINDLIEHRINSIHGLMEQGLHEHVEYAAMVAEVRGLKAIPAASEAIEEAANRAEQALNDLAVGLAAGDTA